MNDKQYLPCIENGVQTPFSTPFSIIPGTFSPTGTFNDIYPSLLSQNSTQRTQNRTQENTYTFPDLPSWESIKISEKIDLIEINSKDLSPGSYCSNIDNILVSENNFNAGGNGCNARFENHWYGNSNNSSFGQKAGELPSCSQMTKYYGDSSKSLGYCSIQKGPTETENLKSCAYYNSETTYPENTDLYYKNKQLESSANFYNNYITYYDPKYQEVSSENNFYHQNSVPENIVPYVPTIPLKNTNADITIPYVSNITPIDQQTEASNEESDIIVEDSDSDYSEDQEKRLFYQMTKCLICNTVYTPLGLQFYFLTMENPLTMSTQIPVIKKVLKIVGNNINRSKNYLCNDCLGLVNTIDHLQLKLNQFIKDFVAKFKKSCLENNINYKNKNRSKKDMKFRKYKCKLCKKVLCLKTYFESHVKRHRSKGYLCELCGKIFPSFKKFKCHLKNHKKKNTKMIEPYTCSNKTCDKFFRTQSNLKEHENFCLGTLPFKCKNQHCDKKFASATKLKNHTKFKHDKKFVAICSICNIGFIKISDYKSHMISHSTDKKFSCEKCDKTYKTLSNLNFHMKIHNGNLPFTCTICQKGFMRKEYLEAHVNNHKGIKNYSCQICDKKFVSQKNLDSHLKYHEGTVKSNTCNICGKSVTSGFEEHLRVHSNLREFECDMCDMRFNTKNTLGKHRKRKHGNEENCIDK